MGSQFGAAFSICLLLLYYVYSSALDYADEKGLLDNIVVFQYLG